GVFAGFNVNEGAYLVMDIPAQKLLPGDVLFALTKIDPTQGPNWGPGHVGILRRLANPSANVQFDGIVESTPDFVRSGRFDEFKVEYGHLYMGARRPRSQLTVAERKRAIDF